ncbi:MAG: hypothetical protein QE495_01410 [Acidovorax sp.]|uniref:hypothetical protein n=1 Tax=Acidovorax sp. TaxID=1872122 RepID=UPI0026017AF4|nr:hypothetical protein [Acidovorax sp.]MDH4425085.1 hypothetical protein [Acidovorax sp.]
MRPAGEVRLALLNACNQLATAERGPTLREMAAVACVGVKAATHTIKHMSRAGQVRIARQRRVEYRNRPVAEYVPATQVADERAGYVDLAAVLQVWGA